MINRSFLNQSSRPTHRCAHSIFFTKDISEWVQRIVLHLVRNNEEAGGHSLTGVDAVTWFEVEHRAEPGMVQERTRDVALRDDRYREA